MIGGSRHRYYWGTKYATFITWHICWLVWYLSITYIDNEKKITPSPAKKDKKKYGAQDSETAGIGKNRDLFITFSSYVE